MRVHLDDNDRLAEVVRRAMRDGLPNQSLEDVNKSPFTSNIQYNRNPSNFKLSTLETYDEQIDPIVHLMRYFQHMELLGASEEVIG